MEDLYKKYSINELIVSKTDDQGSSLLVSLDESDSFYRIDGIASEAWNLLVQNPNLEEITKKLTAEYPDHKDQLLVDLEAFFLKLIELKVLIEQK
jgi:hypothetical protein